MTSHPCLQTPFKAPIRLTFTWLPEGSTPWCTTTLSSLFGRTARTLGSFAALMLSLPAFAASFQSLGDLPGGSVESRAYGVSAAGNVVVGASASSHGTEAFQWTPETGMVGLGDLPGGDFFSRANGVSANGTVIVGTSASSRGTEAFRWTRENGMVGLGDLPGGDFYSEGNGVSANGNVVVGTSQVDRYGYAPFRWTETDGMVSLGGFNGARFEGRGVSADGTVVVGTFADYAFRWTAATGMTDLGTLSGGEIFYSMAYGVSSNGAVVVGSSFTATGFNDGVPNRYGDEAFRWTEDQGMIGLGALPGAPTGNYFHSVAEAVSADGNVIVGASDSGEGRQAFLWDDKNGMRSLLDVLVASGLNLTGWWLTEATSISADGLTIVGYGRNPAGLIEGWVATLAPAVVPEIQVSRASTGLALLAGGLLLLGEGARKRRSPAASLGAD